MADEHLLARRQAEIERPIDDVGAPETGVAVVIAHAQDGDGGQMSARGLATYGQGVGTKLFLGVLNEPGAAVSQSSGPAG